MLPGPGSGGMGSYCLIGTVFQFGVMEEFWGWILVRVAPQCGCV